MWSRAIRIVLTLAVLVSGGWLADLTVIRPGRQNLTLGPAIYDWKSFTVPDARDYLAVQSRVGHWDPYLEGFRSIADARMFRITGRNAEAHEAYRKALGGRVSMAYWLEVGLFEMASGRYELGHELVLEAIRFDPTLIRLIDDTEIRSQLRAELED